MWYYCLFPYYTEMIRLHVITGKISSINSTTSEARIGCNKYDFFKNRIKIYRTSSIDGVLKVVNKQQDWSSLLALAQ